MNAMQWVAQTMNAEQLRLTAATGNLANAHVRGYAPQRFSANLDEAGVHAQIAAPASTTASDKLPEQNSATVMIEVLQAQRDFETAQKVALSVDGVRAKDASELARSAA